MKEIMISIEEYERLQQCESTLNEIKEYVKKWRKAPKYKKFDYSINGILKIMDENQKMVVNDEKEK